MLKISLEHLPPLHVINHPKNAHRGHVEVPRKGNVARGSIFPNHSWHFNTLCFRSNPSWHFGFLCFVSNDMTITQIFYSLGIQWPIIVVLIFLLSCMTLDKLFRLGLERIALQDGRLEGSATSIYWKGPTWRQFWRILN